MLPLQKVTVQSLVRKLRSHLLHGMGKRCKKKKKIFFFPGTCVKIFIRVGDLSEKEMATHPSTLAWKIPWAEEPGRLQSMGSLRVGHDWATSLSLFTFHALEKEMAAHSSVLAWRIPGTGEPGGLRSMGSHRVGHDWSDLAAAAAAGDL